MSRERALSLSCLAWSVFIVYLLVPSWGENRLSGGLLGFTIKLGDRHHADLCNPLRLVAAIWRDLTGTDFPFDLELRALGQRCGELPALSPDDAAMPSRFGLPFAAVAVLP